MSERPRTEFPLFSREGKPRDKGITIATDLFAAIERYSLEESSEYVDYAKIGLSLPLILERPKLVERIRFFHDLGIKVCSGGTLIQVALTKQILPIVLDKLRSLGFDAVELSESASTIAYETKEGILESISKLSMEFFVEVGNKDSRRSSSTEYLISKIEEAFKLKSRKVIVEAGENGRGVGFFNQQGEISWDILNEIVGRFGPPNLVFEAPQASQRCALILEFGPNVNIASVPLNEILPLEMQRLGLTTETLGLSPSVQSVDGSPAAKFVYYLIKTEHPIDQITLTQRSGLPKRTLQAALSYLVEKGLVRQVTDMSDLRRHKYTPK